VGGSELLGPSLGTGNWIGLLDGVPVGPAVIKMLGVSIGTAVSGEAIVGDGVVAANVGIDDGATNEFEGADVCGMMIGLPDGVAVGPAVIKMLGVSVGTAASGEAIVGDGVVATNVGIDDGATNEFEGADVCGMMIGLPDGVAVGPAVIKMLGVSVGTAASGEAIVGDGVVATNVGIDDGATNEFEGADVCGMMIGLPDGVAVGPAVIKMLGVSVGTAVSGEAIVGDGVVAANVGIDDGATNEFEGADVCGMMIGLPDGVAVGPAVIKMLGVSVGTAVSGEEIGRAHV